MYNTPYQTTPCAQYVLTDTLRHLQAAMINGELLPLTLENGKAVDGVFQVSPECKSVPAFSQPIQYTTVSGRQVLVCDPRAMVRMGLDRKLKVVATAEYQLLRTYTLLVQVWLSGKQDEIAALTDLPLQAYNRWVTEAIVRRLGLTPSDQMQLSILTAYFYLCQFTSAESLNERDRTGWAGKISRVTRVNVDTVMAMLESVPLMANVTDFTTQASQFVQTTRLERFNPGLLYSMLGGSWFGANAREFVAVAVEYPPALLAMLYSATIDRSYRNTGFTRLVEQLNRGGAHATYQKALGQLLGALSDE